MTANDTTPSREQESTESNEQLFGGETSCGSVVAEAFFAGSTGVKIDSTDGAVRVGIRGAEGRGLKLNWFLSIEDAREVVDELAETIDELEIEES